MGPLIEAKRIKVLKPRQSVIPHHVNYYEYDFSLINSRPSIGLAFQAKAHPTLSLAQTNQTHCHLSQMIAFHQFLLFRLAI